MPHRRTSRSRRRGSTQDWTRLLNLVTSLTAIGALVFTGLSLQATREELDIAQTGQITERFTRAVEHLGDEETMDVRLGAVLALERIARDSAADREAVAQLLAAFVRRKRPTDGPCAQGIGRDHADVEAALRVVSTGQRGQADGSPHRREHLRQSRGQGGRHREGRGGRRRILDRTALRPVTQPGDFP